MYSSAARDRRQWLPRTTFAVNKQYYAEAHNILLQQLQYIRVSLRVKPELLQWLLEPQHNDSFIVQRETSGPVTNFKEYHMHIDIGPANKSLPVLFMLVDSWRLNRFCAQLAAFDPSTNGAGMNVRRLRIRIQCYQRLSTPFLNRRAEAELFDALTEYWWSFEDIIIRGAADAAAGTAAQRRLSRDRWTTEAEFVRFLTPITVNARQFLGAGEPSRALNTLLHRKTLCEVLIYSPQHDAWASGPNTHARRLRYEDDLLSYLLRVEARLRLMQPIVSEANYSSTFRSSVVHAYNEFMEDWAPYTANVAAGLLPRRARTQGVYMRMVALRYLEQFDDAERILREAEVLDIAVGRVRHVRMEKTLSGLLKRAKADLSTGDFTARAVEYVRRPIERVAVVFDCQQRP